MNTKPNIENIDYCIELMRNAKNLDMEDWQSGSNADHHANSIEQLHECNTAACFGGYVAISEKFQKDGGKACRANGMPEIGGFKGHKAIKYWLNISNGLAYDLCFTGRWETKFYSCKIEDVTAEMVIEKLEMIKAGEL